MLYTAFLLGLLGSFHCIGMCGPIAFMLPLDRTNATTKYSQVFLYHFGRLVTYGIIGLCFGLIGKSLNLFGFQQQLSILIGITMILLTLVPSKFLNRFSISKPFYRIISKIKNGLGNQLKKRTPDTFFTIGFLNGWLPCGLVYMAVFGAIALGDIGKGSLYMLFFGIGTIPLMTSAVFLGNIITVKARQRIRSMIPIFVVLIGFLFILRGLGLGIPFLSPAPNMEVVNANYNCDVLSQ